MTRFTKEEKETQRKMIKELYDKYYKIDNPVLRAIRKRETEQKKEKTNERVS